MDTMSMDIGNPYANLYYGDEYAEVAIPEQKYTPGGGGDGVTAEEVQQMINDALSTINISRYDDDTVELNVNGQSAGTIDDVYLNGITIEEDESGDDATVNFMLNNGKSPVQIKRSDLDNPNIDCSTF